MLLQDGPIDILAARLSGLFADPGFGISLRWPIPDACSKCMLKATVDHLRFCNNRSSVGVKAARQILTWIRLGWVTTTWPSFVITASISKHQMPCCHKALHDSQCELEFHEFWADLFIIFLLFFGGFLLDSDVCWLQVECQPHTALSALLKDAHGRYHRASEPKGY